MPEGVQRDKLASSYSADGILTISAPRVITAPEGAKVEEAMAAASKAYTTDDGKTSVKQDSAESSQMIAASTQVEPNTQKIKYIVLLNLRDEFQVKNLKLNTVLRLIHLELSISRLIQSCMKR